MISTICPKKKKKSAIRTLRNNQNIVILPANKSNVVVLLDKKAYDDNVQDLL